MNDRDTKSIWDSYINLNESYLEENLDDNNLDDGSSDKLYAPFQVVEYEGDFFMGIFSSREEARSHLQNYARSQDPQDFDFRGNYKVFGVPINTVVESYALTGDKVDITDPSSKKYDPRVGRSQNDDPLAQRTPPRVTNSGTINKSDAGELKKIIKGDSYKSYAQKLGGIEKKKTLGLPKRPLP